MSFNILVDSCVWISLFDPDQNHLNNSEALRIADEIENHNIIIPFPTLYEFVNSRLSRRDSRLRLEKLLQKSNVVRISDEKYKEQALVNFFTKSGQHYQDISLVDEVVKLIIIDSPVRIDYIATFDEGLLNDALSRGIRKI